MFKNYFTKTNIFSIRMFYNTSFKLFTGKTETGWKFTTPTMKMKSITPLPEPPGDNLELPSIY